MQNLYFFIAGILTLFLGLAHSVLGELLLFRRLVKDQLPPIAGSKGFTLRTLRVTWHVPTILAWGFGAILLSFSLLSFADNNLEFVKKAMAVSFLISSLIVLFGTKGKHPAWIVLLAIAVLTWLGFML